MVSTFARTLAGALLAGTVLASLAAQAQPGRAWSDPPPDLNAGPLTEDSASRAGSARSAEAWPDEAARRMRRAQTARSVPAPEKESPPPRTAAAPQAPDVKETGSTRTARSRDDHPSAEEAAATSAAKAQRAAARAEARAAREAARKEAARQRNVQEAREARARREAAAAQRRRALAARNNGSDRIRTAQPADYEVMRLRTLVYPDGRVVEVLSRPDQDFVDLPLR